jgi:hypothetical protein
MTSDAVSRVRYFPGQFLRTPDFTAEQAYHLAMRRRHNIGHHTFGIVAGLQVVDVEGRVVVEPGMAVDGYGRELVLVTRTPLDVPGAFVARGADRLDVSIAFRLVSADPAPEGYASCTDDDTSYRLVEQPVLRYTVPDPDHSDPRRPATVPEGDLGFGPARTPPDDPLADWPVYLATIARDPEGAVTVHTDGRPYAGLVGEQVRAVSGRATVQVGAERADDPFRFAVRIADVLSPEVPRLAVLRDGEVVVAGRTTLLGNVRVDGVVELAAGPVVETADEAPPQPFTLSRVTYTDGRTDLRLEVDDPDGGTPDAVVVGTHRRPATGPPAFVPCLTVRADGRVTVHGDLVVEGSVLDATRRPVPLGEAAQTLVTAAFLSGVGGASAVVDEFYVSPFPPPEAGPLRRLRRAVPDPVDAVGRAAPDPVDAAVDAVIAVAGDPQALAAFASRLRARDPGLADSLRTALEPGP